MDDLRSNMTKGRGVSKRLLPRESACPHAEGTGRRAIPGWRSNRSSTTGMRPDVAGVGVRLKKEQATKALCPATTIARESRAQAAPHSGRINDYGGTVRRANPIPVCSQINNYDRDQLWTSAALVVDGLRGRLRRFRKSHHLSPASPGTNQNTNRGLHSAASRAPAPCAYQLK
jgi:hypothetical protein